MPAIAACFALALRVFLPRCNFTLVPLCVRFAGWVQLPAFLLRDADAAARQRTIAQLGSFGISPYRFALYCCIPQQNTPTQEYVEMIKSRIIAYWCIAYPLRRHS